MGPHADQNGSSRAPRSPLSRRIAESAARFASRRPWVGPLAALIAVYILFTILSPETFGRTQNLVTMARQTVVVGIAAAGMTLVIISGGIDLSVGFVMGLAAVVMARAMQMLTGMPPGVALGLGLVAAFAVSLVPGLINGLLIARLRVPAFIGTLGMYGVARGTGFLAAGGTTVPVNDPWLFTMGSGKLWGVPIPVLITVALVIAMHYVLSQTRFGQYTYAIGGNRTAALRAGINVRRHTMAIYLISAACAGVAGMVYTARFSAGAAQAGEPLLLDSIAAVVIGGASLFGGSGTVIGTVIGALIIAVIQYGLVFINVEPFWQFVAVGIVIIVSVLVDQSQSRLTGEAKDES